MRTMLFVRDFAGFSGGHVKFLDYLGHTAASGLVEPVLYQTPRSRSVPGNIFNGFEGRTIDALRPFPAYFVAGDDWFLLDRAGVDPGAAPVVNLLQGLRHGDPAEPLFACLARPALRICVSGPVADAVRDHANGEVHVIENGIEIGAVPNRRPLDAPARVLVAGMKNPDLARAVARRLDGLAEIDLLVGPLPRADFLARIAAASICVLLPLEREGFFLPPLEAMALGRGVVTLDCGGNVYCRSGANCLMPLHDADALAGAALSLARDRGALARLAAAGLETAARHSIENERVPYQALLTRYFAGAPTQEP